MYHPSGICSGYGDEDVKQFIAGVYDDPDMEGEIFALLGDGELVHPPEPYKKYTYTVFPADRIHYGPESCFFRCLIFAMAVKRNGGLEYDSDAQHRLDKSACQFISLCVGLQHFDSARMQSKFYSVLGALFRMVVQDCRNCGPSCENREAYLNSFRGSPEEDGKPRAESDNGHNQEEEDDDDEDLSASNSDSTYCDGENCSDGKAFDTQNSSGFGVCLDLTDDLDFSSKKESHVILQQRLHAVLGLWFDFTKQQLFHKPLVEQTVDECVTAWIAHLKTNIGSL